MRKRVALLAACVSMICCMAFVSLYTKATMTNLTISATEDLLRICRMSAEYMDTAAFSAFDAEEGVQIKALAQEIGIDFTILDKDNVLLFDSRNLKQAPTEGNDIELARANGKGTSTGTYRGKATIFASVLMQNNNILRAWTAAPTVFVMISGYLGRFIALGIISFLLCFFLTCSSVRICDTVRTGAEKLMEAFAEGRFDERIEIYGRNAHWINGLNNSAQRIEEQLKKQSSRNQAMSAVMNQMQNGLLAVNRDCEVILITPMAKTLLNVYEPCEKMPVGDLSKDVNLEPIFKEAMNQTGVFSSEIAVREGTNGRGKTPLRLYISPMTQDAQTVGAVAMIEDITELRRLERMRTDFTANVSHELKTPLTSIRGFVETLQDGAIEQPEMARKFLNIIMMEANRLTRLVNDILSISKLEAGDTEVSLGRLRLDKMADDVCEMLQIHAKEKQIALSINENGDPIYVWGNNDRVEQLLINLIENAIKYNQPGGTVHVSVYGTEQNAYLLVSDTGIGIAEEHLPRLFERFYRVDKGRSRSMGGTGLGLAIVKHIVVSMGGTIEVHSKLGEGTEFSVTLPRYVNNDPIESEIDPFESEE